MHYTMLAIGFLVELLAWVGCAALGFVFFDSWLSWIATAIIFVTVVVFWGLYMSPKARYALPIVPYYACKSIIYVVAGAALYHFSPPLLYGSLASVVMSEPFLYKHKQGWIK